MNKKIMLFSLLGLFVLGFGGAALFTHYGFFQQEINVDSPIVLDGITSQFITGWSNTEVPGNPMTVTNIAPFAVDVKISDNAPEGHIDVSYIGTLELTKKDVDFSSDSWNIPDNANKVQLEYTVVGNEFSAKVTSEEIPGYALVYYADNDNRFTNPGETILVEDVAGNLPAVGDFNIVNDYSAEYPSTPFGAKIWYVPLASVGVVDWSEASSFYFESSLIQYNSDGEITVYPTEILDFTPKYKLGNIDGTYSIKTFVTPVTA